MKGFFSLAIVALAAFAIAAIAAYVSSSGFASDARVAELDARLVSERADDAARFMNATLLDALLDSIYANCGCAAGTLTPGGIFADFSANAAAYSAASFRNLSTPLTTVDAAYSLAAFSASSCDSTFEADAAATITANSTRAKKTMAANYSFSPAIHMDGSEFNASVSGMSLSVKCS